MNTICELLAAAFRFGLIGLLVGAVSGCWQEIHYTAPAEESNTKRDASVARDEGRAKSPAPTTADLRSTNSDEAASFADELASSLATENVDTGEPIAGTEPPASREQLINGVSGESSTTQPAPPPMTDPQSNTRRLAWLLGSKLSLAALKRDRGAADEDVAKLFEQSQALARLLGTSAGELPSRTSSDTAGTSADQALNYLFGEGRTIGRSLAERQGDDHAALFELAVKSNVLLALYRPEAPIVGTLSGAIRQTSQRAKLPPELSQPLLDKLERGAPAVEVQEAVFAMYDEVDRHLKSEAAP